MGVPWDRADILPSSIKMHCFPFETVPKEGFADGSDDDKDDDEEDDDILKSSSTCVGW